MTAIDGSYRINLGCGERWKAGWKNVDGGPLARVAQLRALRIFNRWLPKKCFRYPNDLIVADLCCNSLPFRESSASVIFSGYVLEYISQEESDRLLRDCFRILRPGGLIRLCQTDIQSIVEFYLSNKNDVCSEAAAENASAFLRLTAPQHTKLAVRLFRRGGVQQLFDRPSIDFALRKAGFVKIKFHKVHEGECPDLEEVERPEREVAPLLHVEARKPTSRGLERA